jgi:hypothetical protein
MVSSEYQGWRLAGGDTGRTASARDRGGATSTISRWLRRVRLTPKKGLEWPSRTARTGRASADIGACGSATWIQGAWCFWTRGGATNMFRRYERCRRGSACWMSHRGPLEDHDLCGGPARGCCSHQGGALDDDRRAVRLILSREESELSRQLRMRVHLNLTA